MKVPSSITQSLAFVNPREPSVAMNSPPRIVCPTELENISAVIEKIEVRRLRDSLTLRKVDTLRVIAMTRATELASVNIEFPRFVTDFASIFSLEVAAFYGKPFGSREHIS